MSATMTRTKDATAAEKIDEGDKITVEYKSTHGGEKSFTGTVDTVDRHNGVGMVELFIRSDADASQRCEYYVNDDTPDRKVTFLMDDVTVENRNGYRWNKLSETGTDATVTVE